MADVTQVHDLSIICIKDLQCKMLLQCKKRNILKNCYYAHHFMVMFSIILSVTVGYKDRPQSISSTDKHWNSL
jgi:hypothetical protein